MSIDWAKVDELTLALLHLTSFRQGEVTRAWKGHDWEVMKRLFDKGLVSDPVSKARSVVLTDEGRKQAELLFERHFGAGESAARKQVESCPCGCGEFAAGGGFRPGHDQKLRASLESRVGGLLSFRNLVEAAESYARGAATADELGQVVRAAFRHET